MEEEELGKLKKMTKTDKNKLKIKPKSDRGKKPKKMTKTAQGKKLKKTAKTARLERDEEEEEERGQPPVKKPRSSFELPAGFTAIKRTTRTKTYKEYVGPDGTNNLIFVAILLIKTL